MSKSMLLILDSSFGYNVAAATAGIYLASDLFTKKGLELDLIVPNDFYRDYFTGFSAYRDISSMSINLSQAMMIKNSLAEEYQGRVIANNTALAQAMINMHKVNPIIAYLHCFDCREAIADSVEKPAFLPPITVGHSNLLLDMLIDRQAQLVYKEPRNKGISILITDAEQWRTDCLLEQIVFWKEQGKPVVLISKHNLPLHNEKQLRSLCKIYSPQTIWDLCECLLSCRMHICLNGDTMHLAAALTVPTISLQLDSDKLAADSRYSLPSLHYLSCSVLPPSPVEMYADANYLLDYYDLSN